MSPRGEGDDPDRHQRVLLHPASDTAELIRHDRRILADADVPTDHRLVDDKELARRLRPARQVRLTLEAKLGDGSHPSCGGCADIRHYDGVPWGLQQARYKAVLELPDGHRSGLIAYVLEVGRVYLPRVGVPPGPLACDPMTGVKQLDRSRLGNPVLCEQSVEVRGGDCTVPAFDLDQLGRRPAKCCRDLRVRQLPLPAQAGEFPAEEGT